MEDTIEEIKLDFTPTFKQKTYFVLREERHRFEGVSSENFIESYLKIKHIRTFKNNINRFDVSQYNYKQSNAKGMYKWAGDLHSLRKNLVLDIDAFGHIVNVENHYLIKMYWEELLYDIKKIHKKDPYVHYMIKNISIIMNSKKSYTNLIKYSYPFINIFPHIYNKTLSDKTEVKGYRELNSFIGSKKVPIITSEKLKEIHTGANTIEVVATGEIDQDNFKQDHVSQMIKTLKNRPRVPTQVKLNYTERYLLDSSYSPMQVMCLSLLRIPGTLYREEKTIVKQLSVE